ncbi:D-alanyl-D-alanine carboxypeptidase/D-alanyl-D-alanine-endopeptidase (penicillin-binding protein 4) [Stackebrandtia albiflava]|uniref:D-alanyl-D-alanine carboxypeptidase/D-alanyl-D-alanine-endopeptidase (Penicillin-binding protein 4) n=1 Tax=Stackebrandtia albiflava TaxID=406432 RepID=A0A562V9S5_9ACTN|nr:D-alanyl-D-alanine carboxypeptidase/D-alanyl-D-alanine-endopeptidase [Stackebrandtia albiflava]TWJ14612.1 D-alanyl-D-alanine carboxypeptidase/D-alanyl-D-alanine-endopeptidase (penicillin-binding protein 4) [Stackebrandtia albiflava]
MPKRPHAHILAAVAVTAIGLTTATVVSAEEPGDARLTAALDEILADDRLYGSQAGLVVADAQTGDILYDRGGNQRLVPASNTKLLTSAAAMEILGADHRFVTDVAHDGRIRGKTLHGDLYLRGTGDPTMLAEDYDALAARIAEAGVKTVKGDLVADDTAYDAVRLGPEWGWDDQSYYYSAQISALTVAPDTDYDAGTVIVTVDGGESGDAPEVSVEPATDYVDFDIRATTVAADGETDLTVEREHGTNTIVVTGEIAAGDSVGEWVTVWEPTGYAADVFASALREHGVRVKGDVRLGEATPADAEVLADHRSMPLSELLVPFMKLSNNGHAETLTKAIGLHVSGEGSWPAGLAAVEDFVAGLGMDTDAQRQSDGSGLSRWNLIPPREFIDLLVSARGADWFDAWYASLPVACDSERFVGGTLRSRMCDTPAEGNVRAKTGSLTSVSGLSGYVTDADGRELVFSLISNDYLAGSVKNLEDAVAITLASFSTEDTGTASTYDAMESTPDSGRADVECSWTKDGC